MDSGLFNIYVILGFDLLIVVFLALIFMRTRRTGEEPKSIDFLKIKSLKGSLEKSMLDSEEVTRELLNRLSEKVLELNSILEKIQEKESQLKGYLELVKSPPSAHSEQPRHEILPPADPYKTAAELISRGCSIDEVKRRSGLSGTEIELIRQVERYKQQ